MRRKLRQEKLFTGRMMIWAGFIPFPSGPCFAIADIARIAIDDAVSNPGLAFSHGQFVDMASLYRNRTIVPPGTSRSRGLNLLLDKVEQHLPSRDDPRR